MVVAIVGAGERDEIGRLVEGKLEAGDGDETSVKGPDSTSLSTDGVKVDAVLDCARIVRTISVSEGIKVLVEISIAFEIDIKESKLKVLTTEIKTVDLEFFGRRTVQITSVRENERSDILDGEIDALVLELILKVRSEARIIVVVVGVDGEMSEGADVVVESVGFVCVAGTIIPAIRG